jgi:hypothetical protein
VTAEERVPLRRVDVGFASGQVLSLRVREEVYAELRQALDSQEGRRWHQVPTEDSEVTVDLSKVDYVRLETETHRVGF